MTVIIKTLNTAKFYGAHVTNTITVDDDAILSDVKFVDFKAWINYTKSGDTYTLLRLWKRNDTYTLLRLGKQMIHIHY